ncbi:CCGSCS motif protein [Marinobacter maroccanus]|uniref:CCGSCS motif protein n=1 Tax=Marinobacter maroccanus TaxID=2055143 RepID=A0A2S5ZDX2_9GAMM|nr:CCGSCS motif protein [Marinobacter maroccanus]
MALSFLSIFKKEDKETESTSAQEVDPKEQAEASQQETPKKSGHGGGACCGSCS